MEEEWRDVPGFSGYRVSDQGRVLGVSGKILKPRFQNMGYPRVSLRRNGSTHDRLISRIVAETFHGPCPEGMECAHLNGDPSDSRASNLKWATHSENLSHRVGHGTANRGARHGNSKLTEVAVRRIRGRVRSGESMNSVGRSEGVAGQTVSKLMSGKLWGWLDA
jgi:hypothetical protein